MVDVLECTGYSDQSEHVIAHATFHGNWFAIFVFNPGCSSFSRHLFESLAEFCVGFDDAFAFVWSW
jgi:hypothetical protein